MRKSKIIVHCLVANEERFVWYAINSILPFVDKIIVWDTGSSDRTVDLIKKVNSRKVELREFRAVDAQGHTNARDSMLRETPQKKYDWLLILDGDEIWTEGMFQKMISYAEKIKPSAVVVKTVNFVGDIYHKEPDSAGHYRFGNYIGHYNLRLINLKLPNLHVRGVHGQQGYYSGRELLQNLPESELLILDDVYYFHATHLERSPFDRTTTKRSFKKKYEFGEKIEKSLLPEILFSHPQEIPDVTTKYDLSFLIKATIQTIPRRVKRFFFPPKEGY